MRLGLVFSLCFFCSLHVYAQTNNVVKPDTVLFENGKLVVTHVVDTIGEDIVIEKPHSSKHKKISIDRNSIFSIRYGNTGKESVLYIHDTLTGNYFTVAQARLFIAGEQDAQRGYHAFGTSFFGLLLGTASGLTGVSFLVIAPPILYTAFMSIPRVHVRRRSVHNMNDVKSDAYLYGYDSTARRKRVIKSLLWGGIGVIVGSFIHYKYLQN